jgi:hypothetical protein
MTDDTTPGGPDRDPGEQPEHDSVTPALEDEPTEDEPTEDEPTEDEPTEDEAARPLAGDDELASGQYGPGTPQAGT